MTMLPWHKNAFAQLKQMIDQNHLPHALLITGAQSIGKFELMQQLIGVLLNDDAIIRGDNVRDNLDYPVLIRRSKYINMIYCRAGEINPKSKTNNRSKDIRVDQIRSFCDALGKTASGLQIGVIFYADQMNANAANSLLKTLEEPRENTLIVLLAHNIKRLPITIVSRCQRVHINPSYDNTTQEWVKQNIKNNEDFNILHLLESTHGVPFKVLEDLSNDNFVHYQKWQNQLLNIAIHPTLINKLEDFDGNEVEVLSCLQRLIIDGIHLKTLNREGGLVELNKIISITKIDFLFKLLDDIAYAINLSKTNVNIKLLLDNVLIVWSHITHLKTYPKFLEKI